MANKVYTINEVAQHNKETDLWLVMHDGVYDLTDFYKKHPGGEEVLINSAGTDCTKCFDEIGHSEEAILLKETFKIGVIKKDEELTKDLNADHQSEARTEEATTTNPTTSATIDDDDWEYTEPKKDSDRTLPFVVAAGVLIYAILFYYFFL
ncbi:PREDICTED: cytochrome b5-like [Polistes dominula]|uniref:Cytochrome b5-like n=1 Tax=Polistes dominula TaxID=743375 RepID=A0ABM1IDN6_POLDO|nr:PREDICTED: cytochrome b5-like [Polistes dominula]